ncbi:flagellar motor switch protein FliM [Nocardioides caldifontis]|uniref:flagellar motor switch protein FliM n=1 Tax=Nocardioides caldifontis TaxID=2588938 RepID=UPI001EF0A65B|nr:flagellar motor switch protein FliM [Nocardioides caldifontis]
MPYDFRRPIQLSREHSRTLQIALDGFARQATTVFTSSLRTVSSLTLARVEQRSYGEYVQSLGSSTYMTLFSAEPISGSGILEVPIRATMECIDHMLGGPGGPSQPERPLTEIESVVARGLVERLLRELRYSLEEVVSIEPLVTGVEYSPQFAQAAGSADIMVVATFDLRVDDGAHQLTLCLPFSGLHPHLVKASAPVPASDRERAKRAMAAELLQEQFRDVPVEVKVVLRRTPMAPERIGRLAVGDVLRLSHPAAAPLDVTVDDEVFAHAMPGAHGKRLAAQIVATPQKELP